MANSVITLLFATHEGSRGLELFGFGVVVAVAQGRNRDRCQPRSRWPHPTRRWSIPPPPPGTGSTRGLSLSCRPKPASFSFTSSIELGTEVADVQQIGLAAADQLADGVDTLALEAVVGPDGDVEILDGHGECRDRVRLGR